MKHKHNIYLIFISLLYSLVCFSCSESDDGTNEKESEFEISISSAFTRISSENTDPDYRVTHFRILAFDATTSDKECLYNFDYKVVPNNGVVSFLVKHGVKYDLVFIANEDSDADVSAALQAFTPQSGKKLKDVYDIAFKNEAFDVDKDIPMSAIISNLEVFPDRTYKINGGAVGVGIIPVYMERLGVRLDITLKTESTNKMADLEHIRLTNVPQTVPLFPVNYDGTPIDNTKNGGSDNYTYRLILPSEGDKNDLNEVWVKDGDEYTWTKARTIIPSTVFSPSTSKTRGIDFVLEYDGSYTYKEGVLLGINTPNTDTSEYYPPNNVPEPTDAENYTLPRNTRLIFEAFIEDNNIILGSIVVNAWGNKTDIGLED